MQALFQGIQYELNAASDVLTEVSFEIDADFTIVSKSESTVSADSNWYTVDLSRIPTITGIRISTTETLNCKINSGNQFTITGEFVLLGSVDSIEVQNDGEDDADFNSFVWGQS